MAIKAEAIKVFNVETGRYPYGWATEIAKEYGIHRSYVYDLINGKKKKKTTKKKKKTTKKKPEEKKEEGKWKELLNRRPIIPKKSVIPKHWLMILDDNIKQYPKIRKKGKSKGQKRGKNKNFIIKSCLEDLNLTEDEFINKIKAF